MRWPSTKLTWVGVLLDVVWVSREDRPIRPICCLTLPGLRNRKSLTISLFAPRVSMCIRYATLGCRDQQNACAPRR